MQKLNRIFSNRPLRKIVCRRDYSSATSSKSATFLWGEYQRLKELLGDNQMTPIVNPKAVFANNELHLGSIDVYGFDYDYTLAVYKKTLNNLIYEFGRERLIQDFKVSKNFMQMKEID